MSIFDFMDKAKGLSTNPLGIIALFISLLYGLATITLSNNISNLISPNERLPVIWFIILFPIILLIVFSFLVTKHHEKLYGPKDFQNADSFEKLVEKAKNKLYPEFNESIPNEDLKDNVINEIQKNNTPSNISNLTESDKELLDIANSIFINVNKLAKPDLIKSFGIGFHSPEYYLFRIEYKDEFRTKFHIASEGLIVHIFKHNNRPIIIGIGKGIVETSPEMFTEKLISYIRDRIQFYEKNNFNPIK